MRKDRKLTAGAAALLLGALSACGDTGDAALETASRDGPLQTEQVSTQTANAAGRVDQSSESLPLVVVHKSPTCGCCNAWIEHLRAYGFTVESRDHEDMGQVKAALGVPHGYGSCHTAEVDGYVIEGHVPAADIHRLLAERPSLRGLTVPGMPVGSPGMEQGTRVQPYEVIGFGDAGLETFARHGGE